jgi:metal-responsive CopG/Arc/MetJ family transcriptional regulator
MATRKQVLVQFTDELLAKTDEYAAEHDVSRSELVREAVAEYLTRRSTEEKDRRWIEGYQRVPLTADEHEWLEASARELGRASPDDEW